MNNYTPPVFGNDRRLYSISDYETLALTRFHKYAKDYFNSGANDMVSLQA